MSEVIPPLTDGFSRARLTALVGAAALALVHLSVIEIEKPLPIIAITLPDRKVAETAFALVTIYSMVRVLMEWHQAEKIRRNTKTARVELALALLIPGGVLSWYFLAGFNYTAIGELPLLPTAAITLAGFFTGQFAALWLRFLPVIRTREEALRLGLHRLPFALRSQAKMTAWWLLSVVFVLCLSPAFKYPLDELWPWLLGLPAVIAPLSLILEFAGCMFSRDRERRSLHQHFAHLRETFDWHDATYQTNGWDKPAAHRPTPLMRACTDGDADAVRRLVQAGADLQLAEKLGWTPLAISVAQQHEEIVAILLEKGANPNVANAMGRSPLCFAAHSGNEALVRKLLEYGAVPGAISERFKEPPLHAAARSGSRPVVELLLNAGADPTLLDVHKRNALQYAEDAQHGEIAALLRRWVQTNRV